MFDRKPGGPKPFNKMPMQGRGCGLFAPVAPPVGMKPVGSGRPAPRHVGPGPMPFGGPVPGFGRPAPTPRHKKPAPMPMQGRGCFMM